MQKPVMREGTRVYQLDKVSGEERYADYLSVDKSGVHTALDNNGCGWSGDSDHVSPAIAWNNCGVAKEWMSGEGRDMTRKGDIWPLETGKTATYSYSQINALGANKGRQSRKCKVVGQVNIEVAAGKMDAFKVRCVRHKGDWSQTRVYYFNPDFEHAVKFVRSSSSNGIEDDTELLRTESL